MAKKTSPRSDNDAAPMTIWDVLDWALWATTERAAALRPLVALVRFADTKTWTCYPTVKRITATAFGVDEPTESHVRTTQRHLRWLEKGGHIKIKTNGHSYGNGKRTNLFALRPSRGRRDHPNPGRAGTGRGGKGSPPVVKQAIQGVAKATRQTPKQSSSSKSKKKLLKELDPASDFFWNFRNRLDEPKTGKRNVLDAHDQWVDYKEKFGPKVADTKDARRRLRDLLELKLKQNSPWNSLNKAQREHLIDEAHRYLKKDVHLYEDARKSLGGSRLHAILYTYVFGPKEELKKVGRKSSSR